MFSLQDFPIGSYLYWVRRIKNNPEETVVYSRYKISEHDEDGNLLSDAGAETPILGGPNPETIHFKNQESDGFTIVHPKDKYLNYNPHNMIVPEIYFNIHHFPELLPKTPLAELQKLLGSGLGDIDELIKAAEISFEEWNKNKGFKAVIKLKDLPLNKNVVVVGPPPYGNP